MLERRHRVAQAFAGPYAEFVLAGTVSVASWALPGGAAAELGFRFSMLAYLTIFMNLVPLLELDGYWILSDVIRVPNLRPRSLAFLREDLWRKLRLRERISGRELGLAAYGILGVLFSALSLVAGFFFWRRIFGGLVGRMWRTWPSRALLIVLGAFIAGPLLRESIVLIRSLSRRLREGFRALRFRLQRRWRVEAAEMIAALPLLDDAPPEVLDELAGFVRLRTVPSGRAVVRQGTQAHEFYVVRRGSFEVVEERTRLGSERVLRVLGAGDSFGELGLVEAAPRRATVRALESSQVFEVDKGTFDRLLADRLRMPKLAATLQALDELRALPCFAHLRAVEVRALLGCGRWDEYPPGQDIIRQGQRGDAFYAIGSGQVEVIQDEQPTATLGTGSHFGELALLTDAPRSATVRARTLVRAYRVDREGFDRLVARAFRASALPTRTARGKQMRH